jgi:hypothetical protein
VFITDPLVGAGRIGSLSFDMTSSKEKGNQRGGQSQKRPIRYNGNVELGLVGQSKEYRRNKEYDYTIGSSTVL